MHQDPADPDGPTTTRPPRPPRRTIHEAPDADQAPDDESTTTERQIQRLYL